MRLDTMLYEKGLFASRTKSAEAVKMGEILLNGQVTLKPATEVSENDNILVKQKCRYVSNGGYKLEKAKNDFKISFENLTAIDVGASTGGFTDCMLKNGAKKVFAVDVGENLIDVSLRNNSKVVMIENFNARNLENYSFNEVIDCVTVDCSFISLKYLLKPIINCVKKDGFIVALIKPQFECGRDALSKNGVVIDKKMRLHACLDIYDFVLLNNAVCVDFTVSPLNLRKNEEYLLYIKLDGQPIAKERIIEIFNREE